MAKISAKKSFSSLPFNRVLIYLVLLGTVPLFFSTFHLVKKQKEWRAVAEMLLNLHQISSNAAKKQSLNTTVKNIYEEGDQFYLENQLETLTFLKKEKESLEQLLKSPTFTGNEAAEKRYALLTSRANHFEWTQGSVHVGEGIQQAEIFLTHSVEVDVNDLKEILARIEGNRKGKPQLLITDFKLTKKELSNGNEVFELNMKLLKREFNL